MRALSALPTSLLVLLSTYSLPSVYGDDGDTSGLKIDVTTAVTCSRPSRSGDSISVHYRGTLLSTGEEFDQSYKRGRPFTLVLGAGQVIKGWDQGLVDMCPGEHRTLTIPPELAYGPSGRPPVIPPSATLVFETELVDIVGVEQESLSFAPTSMAATATEPSLSIATAPPTPPVDDEKEGDVLEEPELEATPLGDEDGPKKEVQCHLLGPFALLVQGALGAVAVLTLVYKRWRETTKRPWKIWFFDVSKQVFGSMLTHVLNLAMSMLGSIDMLNAAQKAAETAKPSESGRRTPNPCSFYLLNLAIDTTIGVGVLYILLKVLHGLFKFTPLAKPPESIKSGNYGQPPKFTWYLKQSLIYFIGLTGMKLFVFFLFAAMPWLPWIGDWILRFTEGSEALQIIFAMFIFPLIMNAVQYWVIDNLIMDKQRGKEDGHGYEQVQGDEDDDAGEEDAETVAALEVDASGKDTEEPPLEEASPTPISSYHQSGQRSRNPSPRAEDTSNMSEVREGGRA